jgi:uncharacterized protein (DUF433 family)
MPTTMNIQETLDRQGLIHTDPDIMSGTPVFVGTRVPLQTFFDYLEGTSGFANSSKISPISMAQQLRS